MECTDREGDTLSVTRAQENTEVAGHAVNAAVRLNLTAAIITQMQSEIDGKIPVSLLDSRGISLPPRPIMRRHACRREATGRSCAPGRLS